MKKPAAPVETRQNATVCPTSLVNPVGYNCDEEHFYSNGMTFYEELGIPPDAMPDTIREAYRNVARLLHPDAQTNPVLKESAEVQMKRINHLYEILSDPERRRRYDQELAGQPERVEPIVIQAPPRSQQFRHGNGGNLAWLAATAICATFIIWLATRESSEPAVYPQARSGQSAEAASPPPGPSPLRRAAAAILPKPNWEGQRGEEIARLRAELAAANADRDRLMKQVAAMEAEHRFQPPPADPRRPRAITPPVSPNMVGLTPAPLVAQASPIEIPLPVGAPAMPAPPHAEPLTSATKARWAGEWIYKQNRTEKPNRALFPPEFIETVISEENGRIRGQYHARFKVADAKISPNVDFRFEGTISGMYGHFSWRGTDGAKGDVQLRLVSETTLEVVWAATSLGKSMGLASGTAVLNRKN